MNTLACLTLLGCLITTVAWAGTIDEFSRSVVFLSQKVPVTEDINGIKLEVWLKLPNTNVFVPKQRTITGSGLIVVSSNVSYLITARHVATAMTDECEVAMRGDNLKPIQFQISAITGQPQIGWRHHKDVDISIHPLPSITPEGGTALTGRAMPLDFLASQTNLPSRDSHVTVLGFPLGLGAEREFIPLSRDSKVSSGILEDKDGLFFLLQDPSVSGYSGGPLFTTGEPRVVATDPSPRSIKVVSGGAGCWGFVSGTYSDDTGGKMTRVIPAFYAAEMVRQAEMEMQIVHVQSSSPEPESK